MLTIKKAFSSTIGQKFLVGITGLGLVLFVILHLLGNLTLFKGDPILFNSYSNSLMELGVLLNIAETALTVVAIIHVGLAIRLRILARRARPISYAETK